MPAGGSEANVAYAPSVADAPHVAAGARSERCCTLASGHLAGK